MIFVVRYFLGDIMKKISIVCLIFGAILLIRGIGVRLAVDNNQNTKDLNEIATFFVGEGISPSLISKLMNGEVKVFGQSVTLDDLLEMSDNEDVAELESILASVEKKEAVKESIVRRYPFAGVMTESNFAKFASLRPKQKKRVADFIDEYQIFYV